MTSAFGINILHLILSRVSNQLFKELELAHLILGQMVTCIYRSKKMHRKQYFAVPLRKTGEKKKFKEKEWHSVLQRHFSPLGHK